MDPPKTRQENKKNQKSKGKQEHRLGTTKHMRAVDALKERKGK
ncbi:MAG: hypothetical protein ORN83_05015 [Chthoniobacteraceae bacterium]|nr:hypothetical protein [Chthoniobacteraceae bacterium]